MAADSLSATFSALADPTRRAIVARLALGSATVKELSAPFSMSGPAISKHLRVLERAGLIRQGREAQWRPCQLEAAPLKAVADFAENYRRFWEESFDRLEEYLEEIQSGSVASAEGGLPGDAEPKRRRTRSVRSAGHTKSKKRQNDQKKQSRHGHRPRKSP